MNLQTAERVRKTLIITGTTAKETSAETRSSARAGCMVLLAACKHKSRTQEALGSGSSPGVEPGAGWVKGWGEACSLWFLELQGIWKFDLD